MLILVKYFLVLNSPKFNGKHLDTLIQPN